MHNQRMAGNLGKAIFELLQRRNFQVDLRSQTRDLTLIVRSLPPCAKMTWCGIYLKGNTESTAIKG